MDQRTDALPSVSVVVPRYGASEPTLTLVEVLGSQYAGTKLRFIIGDARQARCPSSTVCRSSGGRRTVGSAQRAIQAWRLPQATFLPPSREEFHLLAGSTR